jgi:putative membrane protein
MLLCHGIFFYFFSKLKIKKMTKKIFYSVFAFSIMFLSSCMSSKTDTKRIAMKENKEKLSKDLKHDAWFSVCATDGGMLEVKLGDLAQANSMSDKVKQFGKKMVDDHSKANSELRSIATGKNISLPGQLSDKSQKTYDKLSKCSGKKFDKKYMKCMVKDHKMDLHAFKMESKKGKDTDIKKFAADKIPVLKDHLALAKKTCKELKK